MRQRRTAFTRIYDLDQMIRQGTLRSAGEAADRLGVSRRSIERDLEQLRWQLGVEIAYNRERGRYEYVGSPAQLPTRCLSERDLAVLMIAERALNTITGTPLRDDIHPAINKLLEMAPRDPEFMERARQLCGSVFFSSPGRPYADVSEQFDKAAMAILEEKRFSFDYRKLKSEKWDRRTVEPYILLNENGQWYLVGKCRRVAAIRSFKLSRMRKPEVIDHYFGRPDSFDPRKYLDSGFAALHGGTPETVQIRITGPVKEWLRENQLHHTQRLRTLKDGDLLLTMKTPLFDTLVSWVLYVGGDATVIGPPELKRRVIERARRICDNG